MAFPESASRNFNIRGALSSVNENHYSCCSNVNLSGVNSNVIMSGCGDDNPDDEGREADRGHSTVFRGELTVGEAAMILAVSERQCYRIKARSRSKGPKEWFTAIGRRPCQRKVKNKTVKRIVELARGK